VAYTVNKTSGAVLSVIADGTLDTTTNLILIGKNYSGYGEVQNENFVKLLENFANSSAPSTPLAGQLWWDTTNTALKVYTGGAWVESGGVTSASTAPASPVEGDLWFDTTNDQLKAYNGSTWIIIGPSYSGGVLSGAIVDTIVDNASASHTVVKMYVANTLVVIVSKDSVFTPNVSITGFATVSPGYNLSTNVTGAKYTGTATDSDALGGVAAANYLRSNANDTTSGTLGVVNDNGMTVGVDSDLSMSVSGNDVTVKNVTSNGNLLLGINMGGSPTTAITIDGSTNSVTVSGDLTVSGTTTTLNTNNLLVEDPLIVVAKNVSGVPSFDAGLIVERGASANTGFFWDESADEWAAANTTETGSTAGNVTIDSYANIHCGVMTGTSTRARYADLAEKFTADYAYDPGTVLQIGGQQEVTMCEKDASEDVLGVVSSYPAYLMNSEEDGVTVAIAGRVPVKVSGPITKGDRLVSAGNGTARRASKEECTPWNVIGRALESDSDKEEAHITLIMCIVKVV
jgi:hypothetical protein